MQRLSLNLLSNSVNLLKALESESISTRASVLHEKASYYRVFSVDIDALLAVATTCKWIVSVGNSLFLTDRGCTILNHKTYEMSPDLLKLMLEDYVLGVKPIWSNRIPYGREEAGIFMNKDERSCFQEAGLFSDNPSQNVVLWWDNIADVIRGKKQQQLLSIGRRGEEYTLEYESQRTKSQPKWISLDSNLAGYDILSKVSSENNMKLLIEVKSSTEVIDSACFHLTRNEWNVASSSGNYVFYLWLLSSYKKQLAVLSPNIIENYIPVDKLNGKWEIVSIPFKNFLKFFSEV